MRLSYSALDTFETCPAKYKFQIIDRIKTPKSKEAVFGTLIHAALKMLHQPNRLTPLSEEELLQYFSQNWDSSIYQNQALPDGGQAEEMAFFHQGIKILKDYYAKNHPSKFTIVDLESPFETPITDGPETHLITGKIDRVDKLEDGAFEIIDYKTTKKMPSQKMVDENFQLSIYHLGVTNRWPSLQGKSIKLSLYFLKHGEKLSAFRTAENLNQTKEDIIKIIRKIKKCLSADQAGSAEGKFDPKPNALCDWCGYQPHCSFFKHKYAKNQLSTINTEQAKNLVNEFLELKLKTDELNKKMAEIKVMLNDYCNQGSLERLFGDKGYITRLSQKRFCYDSELIRQILEPLGKWTQIIAIDSAKLKKTVKELPFEIRKKIDEAKKLEKEFKVLSVKYTIKANIPPALSQEN